MKDKSDWVICKQCRGDGTVVNPSIDCGGISPEEFMDDPDFMDDYMSGVFDVPCSMCNGSGKIREAEVKEFYERAADEAADRRVQMMESGIYEPGISDYRFTSYKQSD